MRNWNYIFELSNSDAIVIDPLDDSLINDFLDKKGTKRQTRQNTDKPIGFESNFECNG